MRLFAVLALLALAGCGTAPGPCDRQPGTVYDPGTRTCVDRDGGGNPGNPGNPETPAEMIKRKPR